MTENQIKEETLNESNSEDINTFKAKIKNAYNFIADKMSVLSSNIKTIVSDTMDDIQCMKDRKELESILQDEWFIKFINVTILNYVKDLSNWRNKFNELSREDIMSIAKIANKPKFVNEIADCIEKIYLPEFYKQFCVLVNDSKKIYKLNIEK